MVSRVLQAILLFRHHTGLALVCVHPVKSILLFVVSGLLLPCATRFLLYACKEQI